MVLINLPKLSVWKKDKIRLEIKTRYVYCLISLALLLIHDWIETRQHKRKHEDK